MQEQKKTILYDNGKFYYSKETERKFYFVLTIIMLLFGILTKLGIF
ncbi:MAG: hypothetical protein KAH06_03175 [Desulfobacterales bacterium]|nr:hypothetical protein [Desulfobacterales bacterium]